MRRLLIALLFAASLSAQRGTGELRLKVVDPGGLAVKAFVELVNEGSPFRQSLVTDEDGQVVVKRAPFGIYTIHVQRQGFAPFTGSVEVRSALPAEFVVHLSVNPVNTSIVVSDSDTLVDPHSTGSVDRIGTQTVESRLTSTPGRSLVGLVNSQSGWLYDMKAMPCFIRADRNTRPNSLLMASPSPTIARRASGGDRGR
jgi:hypothetical protein